jgi:hypothetical protein
MGLITPHHRRSNNIVNDFAGAVLPEGSQIDGGQSDGIKGVTASGVPTISPSST